MSTARKSPAVTELDGRLYVAGGYTGSQYYYTMECYNPDTNSWTTKASLIHEVHFFGVN